MFEILASGRRSFFFFSFLITDLWKQIKPAVCTILQDSKLGIIMGFGHSRYGRSLNLKRFLKHCPLFFVRFNLYFYLLLIWILHVLDLWGSDHDIAAPTDKSMCQLASMRRNTAILFCLSVWCGCTPWLSRPRETALARLQGPRPGNKSPGWQK